MDQGYGPGMWVRWAAMFGIPRAFLSVQASRGEPLARLLLGQVHGADLYRMIEEIRREGRLVRKPFVWVSADHDICRTVLRDDRFGATNSAKRGLPRPLTALISRTDHGLPNPGEPPSMLMTDPPDHTRYRLLVAQGFTPRAITKLSDRVGEVASELLDKLAGHPRPDLLAEFATVLPLAVIAEILGLPGDSHSRLLEIGHAGAPLLDVGIRWSTFRCAMNALHDGDHFLSEHLERVRHGDAGDTPFSRLAVDGSLNHRELAANAGLLIGAGFETTVNLIGNGIVLLLAYPDQLALVLDDPDLWPAAVEEILRFDSPVQMTVRTALRDAEIAGHHIGAGEMIVLLLGGANRDPEVFNRPHRFDITRPNARDHLAFSSGVHACLGAALARIEGTTALSELFSRFPHLRLLEHPKPRAMFNLHGYQQLQADLCAGQSEDVLRGPNVDPPNSCHSGR